MFYTLNYVGHLLFCLHNICDRINSQYQSMTFEIAFRLADKDKSGYITKSEFEKMAKNLSKEQIEKVFQKCDKDGDGKINFSEFSSMMAMAKK